MQGTADEALNDNADGAQSGSLRREAQDQVPVKWFGHEV